MSDPHDLLPQAGEAAGRRDDESGPDPWDAETLPPDDPDASRERHDAFTAARKRDFLKALVKTGCVLDACRLTGVSARTVYRHQGEDARFLEHCTAALAMCEMPVEITAWQRAVEGTEERFAAGGKVYTRTRYSDNLLRLLLQGSNPGKYGPRPGFKRKRMLKHERRQMEREIRAEISARRPDRQASIEKLIRQIKGLAESDRTEKMAAGWTRIALEDQPGGYYLIPPGYGPVEGSQPPAASAPGEEGTPLDSMCHS